MARNSFATPCGQLDATKISFSPDDFAIIVAQEQQIMANEAATELERAFFALEFGVIRDDERRGVTYASQQDESAEAIALACTPRA